MRCDAAREAMHRELDGELSPGESRTLRDHLRACRDCARFAAQLREVADELNALREATQLDEQRPARVRRAAGGWGVRSASGALAACVALLLFRGLALPEAVSDRPLALAPESANHRTQAADVRRTAHSASVAVSPNALGAASRGALLALSGESAVAYLPLELAVSVPQVRIVVLYPRVGAVGAEALDASMRSIQETLR